MILRSNNNANANGGVAYANGGNDSSNTNANNGSRLENPKEINWRTATGTCAWCGAKGDEPYQERLLAGKVKNKVEE